MQDLNHSMYNQAARSGSIDSSTWCFYLYASTDMRNSHSGVPSHVQDTDFTALLQDIASGPASLSELSCKPDEAQESSRPSSEGEKDNMADSASEDVAAASLSAERKSFRQRFNPMRGFLSRRTSSVSLHCVVATLCTATCRGDPRLTTLHPSTLLARLTAYDPPLSDFEIVPFPIMRLLL